MRLDDDGPVLELAKVSLDLRVFGFRLVQPGNWGPWPARILHIGRAPLHIFRLGRRNLVAAGGDEVDAGLLQVDRLVAVVGDNDADRYESVLQVIDAEAAGLLFGVVRVGSDGDMFVNM